MFRKFLPLGVLLLTLAAAGCGGVTEVPRTAARVGTAAGAADGPTATAWDLKAFVVPTLPAQIPAVGSVDPATGLHMTGTPQVVDLSAYRLKVDGLVGRTLSLSYDDLRSLSKITASPDLLCAGNFIDKATWSGVPLGLILEMAEMKPEAKQIELKAADGWSASVGMRDALQPENFLAYDLEGQPLPVLHGFPLRAVFPGLTGYRWVKWLVEITVE